MAYEPEPEPFIGRHIYFAPGEEARVVSIIMSPANAEQRFVVLNLSTGGTISLVDSRDQRNPDVDPLIRWIWKNGYLKRPKLEIRGVDEGTTPGEVEELGGDA